MEKAPFFYSDERRQQYYEKTKSSEPNREAVFAMKYVVNKDYALDIGAGAMTDANYFARSGFKKVAALDINTETLYVDEPNQDIIEVRKLDIHDFQYPVNTYDLVYSRASLHYINPSVFKEVLSNILASVKKDGVLALKFFGPNDEWSTNPNESFPTLKEIQSSLVDFDVLFAKEKEVDGETVHGQIKHWHPAFVVARRK